MANLPKDFPVFMPEPCTHCEQTTNYEMTLSRGGAFITLALYRAVQKKGQNLIHLRDEIEVTKADAKQTNLLRLVNEGKMTSTMIPNVNIPKYFGLVAQGKDPGTYLVTPRGADFLWRGLEIPRFAVIDKRTHTKQRYRTPDTEPELGPFASQCYTTMDKLMRGVDDLFWEGMKFTVAREHLPPQPTLL